MVLDNMRRSVLNRKGPDAARQPHGRGCAIGLFPKADFPSAREQMSDLAAYGDYEDWLDARDGLRLGLAMAGVDATIVQVRFPAFLAWRSLIGASCDEAGLDAFAGLALTFRELRRPQVLAVVDEADFSRRRLAMNEMTGWTEFASWLRHREQVRACAGAAGLSVEELPISLANFFDWCACLGQQPSEPVLDRYARLLLDDLTND